MYKLLFPIILILYFFIKYRLIRQTPQGPEEGKVLYPRGDARFVHGIMSILEMVFVLKFISHDNRSSDAWIRLILLLILFIGVDAVVWLKLKNTQISYDSTGIITRNFLGTTKQIPWANIKEVHTAGTGVKTTRWFTLKTTQGNIKINAKSGGLERFRRIMEERL